MILEADEEDRNFLTIYRQDYFPKKSRKLHKILQADNYPPPLNVLNGPYKEQLNSLRRNAKDPPELRSEDLRDNLQRVRNIFPVLCKMLPNQTPDEDLIERKEKLALRSIYQCDYSRNNIDNYLSMHARRTGAEHPRVTLPENWVIPETIQRISYRNPREMAAELVDRAKMRERPKNNLDPNYEEREILRVRTGESEYGGVIGATGAQILREQLLGPPRPLDPPVLHVKGPDSVKSECSIVIDEQKHPVFSNAL